MRDLNSQHDGLLHMLGSHHVCETWRTSPVTMSAEPVGGRGGTGRMKYYPIVCRRRDMPGNPFADLLFWSRFTDTRWFTRL